MKTSRKPGAQAPADGNKAAPARVVLPAPRPSELRIAVEKRPYAEIIGHAVVEPDVEVCGVLVGRLAEDEHGTYVHVTAALRGEAAREQGAAVTFTHETWNHIHREMDRHHPDDQIVGWYHTHGGFGVFLSEMDTFVHDNFFQEPHHVAYVYDPLAGSEAFFHRRDGVLQPAPRYWLGGRERRPVTQAPEAPAERAPPPPDATTSPQMDRLVAAIEAAADTRSPLVTTVPWAVAAAAVLMLLLGQRGHPTPEAAAAETGPVAILDRDPRSGVAVGLPLVTLVEGDGGGFRDRLGSPRVGVILRAADGTPALQPGLLSRLAPAPRSDAELASERQRLEAAERDRASVTRMLWWGGGGVALLAALLGAGWFFLARR
jgi:proteasome lid subunit RPN8/RPN11